MSYCEYIKKEINKEKKALHKKYHDTQYGFPIHNDNELFGRLILEINQAGLNWDIILKKEKNFRNAYKNFDIKKISKFTQKDIDKLLDDKGIIRNKLKIKASIENALKVLKIQKQFGSFEKWLEYYHPKSEDEWVKIFKKNFKFMGNEVVKEFLMSIGYLKGAHNKKCKIYSKILKDKPMFLIKN